MTIPGYVGRLLRVDLTSGRTWTEELDEASLRFWVGGVALGAKYLFEEVKSGTAWDDPENRLILTSGPVAGSGFSGAATFNAMAKGPMTELAGDFQAPSPTRSLKSLEVEEGSTVRDVFVALARRHQVLAHQVLDPEQAFFNPNVVILYNGRVIPRHGVEDRLLGEGDRITVLPVYAGG